jgi:hypothetical protein
MSWVYGVPVKTNDLRDLQEGYKSTAGQFTFVYCATRMIPRLGGPTGAGRGKEASSARPEK